MYRQIEYMIYKRQKMIISIVPIMQAVQQKPKVATTSSYDKSNYDKLISI